MPERSSVHNDVVITRIVEQVSEREQPGDLRHSGKRGVEEWLDLVAREDRSLLYHLQYGFPVFSQEFGEALGGGNLPCPQVRRAWDAPWRARQRHLQHIRERVCRVRGNQQSVL